MKRMELFDELTYIDDAFILEAHETPVPRHSRFTLRRAAVLLAAVVTVLGMSVAAVATMTEDWKLRLFLLWDHYSFREDTGYFDHHGGVSCDIHTVSWNADEEKILCSMMNVYQEDRAVTYAASDGVTLEVKLEAMVLGNDGIVRYKSRTIQGDGEVTVILDNVIAGEAGTILHVRSTVSALDTEEWIPLYQARNYYPQDFGFQIPVGTDARFPDTKYGNYDGRFSTQSIDLTLPEDTQAQVIVPEKSNVVIVIENTIE